MRLHAPGAPGAHVRCDHARGSERSVLARLDRGHRVTGRSTTSARVRRLAQRLAGYSEVAVAHPVVAYAALAGLQVRILWNIWKYADLTTGDTSYYFVAASSWAHGVQENLIYYPLYDAFWGTILAVVHNVYAATIIQRVAIVLAVTLLVLALMRSLFGPALGLLLATWWAIVPVNYAPLYEVHLFGAVPVLLALLVVARVPQRLGLGIAVAILLAGSVLVRNELLVAAVVLATAIAIYELRALRGGRRATRRAYLLAYGVPLAVACLLIGGAYARSYVQGNAAWQLLAAKEESNFCELYAVAYQQRHPARFTGNPYTQCSILTQQAFGRPMPTFFQALAANPRAVAGFAAWNAQLLPGGLQVGLLGATAFDADPDLTPATERSTYTLVLSLAILIAVIAGLLIVAREGRLSRRKMPPRTLWIVVTVASIAVATAIVALTARPWAEYIYGLTISALIVIGVAAAVLLRRIGATRVIAPAAIGGVLVAALAFPTVYSPGPRPIYDAVQHLQVVRAQLQRPGSVLVAEDNYNELCNYLAYSAERLCTGMYWPALEAQITARTTVGMLLDRVHATAIYADAGMLADPTIARLVAPRRIHGWREVAQGSGPDGPWLVLSRAGQPS